jgi:hypothetical protein
MFDGTVLYFDKITIIVSDFFANYCIRHSESVNSFIL